MVVTFLNSHLSQICQHTVVAPLFLQELTVSVQRTKSFCPQLIILHLLLTGKLLGHKWEDAMTVDKNSWGYRRNTVLSDFLTMDDLTSILASVVR